MDETPEGPVRTIENYVNGTEIFRDIYTTQHVLNVKCHFYLSLEHLPIIGAKIPL